MLLAGGGSGHEPFAAGFVGKGLLSAAVCGNVFASPPTSHISADLNAIHKVDGEAEMVIIGDDVALESSFSRRGLGCRGLAGTIGVGFSACSLPGKGPVFELETNQMKFGLGIHGEPGFERSEKFVVLLNNLGGTSQIELNILFGEIYSWLYEKGYCIHRFYIESVMTSLNGHGISIIILRLKSDDCLRYLDAVAEAPAWKMTHFPPKLSSSVNEIKSTKNKERIDKHIGAALSKEDAKHVEAAVKKACIAIHESLDVLNSLDSKILKFLDEEKLRCDITLTLFNEIIQIFEDDVGGTAGAVDPLHAATIAISHDNPGKAQWENAVKQAEERAKATSGMFAQVGRASNTSTLVQREPDAGAVAVLYGCEQFMKLFIRNSNLKLIIILGFRGIGCMQ